jgi:hypothetical protein
VTPECPHTLLEFAPAVTVVDSPAFVYATLSVRCEACGVLFHWRGLSSGHPNPDQPVVSADGYELRAPIAQPERPTAVMGSTALDPAHTRLTCCCAR